MNQPTIEEIKNIMLSCMLQESISIDDMDKFEEWKFEHSTVDLLELIKILGAELLGDALKNDRRT
jgi:hypothetical protein